ncbi:MAG: PIN domain-containing protein, partial [Rhizomicrobium sp.]
MRLVRDTAAMVAAIRSDAGASRRLLQAALERQRGMTLLVSVPLLIEYEAVMTRTEHLKAARLSAADVGVLLDAVAAVAEPVRLAFLWRPTLPDADDD